MLRLWGAVLLAVSGLLLGLGVAAEEQACIRRLEDWSEALGLLSGELRCRYLDMPTLLETLARRTAGEPAELLHRVGEGLTELGESSFQSIWTRVIASSALDGDELRGVLGLGGVLGRYDRQAQCRAVEELREELSRRCIRRREESLRRGKSSATIGLTLGCLGAILLL